MWKQIKKITEGHIDQFLKCFVSATGTFHQYEYVQAISGHRYIYAHWVPEVRLWICDRHFSCQDLIYHWEPVSHLELAVLNIPHPMKG